MKFLALLCAVVLGSCSAVFQDAADAAGGLSIGAVFPANNETIQSDLTSLSVTFSAPAFAGDGQIVIHRFEDDGVVEAIDVSSDQVVGLGSASITVYPRNELQSESRYYVLTTEAAFRDEKGKAFPAIQNKHRWKFRTGYFEKEILGDWKDSLPFIFNSSEQVAPPFATTGGHSTSSFASNGRGAIAWVQFDGVSSKIYIAERNLSGKWTGPNGLVETISPPGGHALWAPSVSVNRSGNVLVAWVLEPSKNIRKVYAATKINGVWSMPKTILDFISPAAGVRAQSVKVVLSDNNEGAVVWVEDSGGNPAAAGRYDVFVATHDANGVWTTPAELTDGISLKTGGVFSADIGIDKNGNIAVAWSEGNRAYVAERNDGVWSLPLTTADAKSTASAGRPQLAMRPNGNLLLAWGQEHNGNTHMHARYRKGGDWKNIVRLSKTNRSIAYFDLAINPDNNDAVVVWGQSNGSNVAVYKAENINNKWTKPDDLSTESLSISGGNLYNAPNVSMNSSGDIVVAWSQNISPSSRLFKAEKKSGVWSTPSSVADQISFDSGGRIFAGTPSVSVLDNGEAFLSFYQSIYAGATNPDFDGAVMAALAHRSEGIWTLPTPESNNFLMRALITSRPEIAVNDKGDVVVTWNNGNSLYKAIRIDGEWTFPSGLDDVLTFDRSVVYSAVAINNNQDVLISWWQGGNIYKAEFNNGTWSLPADRDDHLFSGGSIGMSPVPALNDAGNAAIALAGSGMFVAEKNAGVWTLPNPATDSLAAPGTGSYSKEPQIVMNSSGNVLLTWEQDGPINNSYPLYKAERISGVWTKPVDEDDSVSVQANNEQLQASIALNDNNEALIAWTQQGVPDPDTAQNERKVFYAQKESGVWAKPGTINDFVSGLPGSTSGVTVALSDNGSALFAWLQSVSDVRQVFISERATNGVWNHPDDLNDHFTKNLGDDLLISDLKVLMNDAGDATLSFSNRDTDLFVFRKESGTWSGNEISDTQNRFSFGEYAIDLGAGSSALNPALVYTGFSRQGNQVGLRFMELK